MADIKLDKDESTLFQEVGSRGEAFRRATRDRAAEQVRLGGRMIEVLDANGRMVDSIAAADADPEAAGPPEPPSDVTP